MSRLALKMCRQDLNDPSQGSNRQSFLGEKVDLGDLESPFQLLAAMIL